MASVHEHSEAAPEFSPFPEGIDSSAMRAMTGFSNHNAEPVDIGHPTRTHPNDNNARWLWIAFRRQSGKYAEFLRNASMDILRTQWWDEDAHSPDAERLFGLLVDRGGKCSICGSEDGIACLKRHFAYNQQ
ncbi:SubName: Full=Uncharacterized protein {ECO:0000313/EMBL:CCA68091.1} [Serendipita indica DSM 11827]|uniref:Uncharacterized protein n=1 Tax=Serendipita indica (strain DSM 11827) TaxID=1109443 RepID=G4T9T8_SERID|nr:SubName: Full=Uncharacterized protein {ECO:0000313/EMBL:CCA68091.1} [Serendipita indica DSM 11827]CCA68091.1 hypothetical protein PIIN_01959 [Serendipita indica DSM 11827]